MTTRSVIREPPPHKSYPSSLTSSSFEFYLPPHHQPCSTPSPPNLPCLENTPLCRAETTPTHQPTKLPEQMETLRLSS